MNARTAQPVSQIKCGILLSYLYIGLSNILQIVLTPLLLRYLGMGGYGLYMLVIAFAGYTALMDLGFANALVRFIAKFREEKDSERERTLLGMGLTIYAALSVLLALVGYGMYRSIPILFSRTLTYAETRQASLMFAILIASAIVSLLTAPFTSALLAYERFTVIKLRNLLRLVLRAALVIGLLRAGFKAVAVVMVDAGLNVLLCAANTFYAMHRLNLRPRFNAFDWKLFRQLIGYSLFILLNLVVDQVYWKVGPTVLGVVASKESVAVFSVAMTFRVLMSYSSTAISSILLPRVTRMAVRGASPAEMTDLMIRVGRFQFGMVLMVLIGFALFGSAFIGLWVGNEFAASWTVALFVMVPLTIPLVQNVGISILQAYNLHGFRAVTYLVTAVLSLGVCILLGRRYGALGAGIATAISLVIGNIIVINLYYRLKVGLEIGRFFRELFRMLPAAMGAGVVGLAISALPGEGWLALLLRGLAFGVVYLIAMWVFAANASERRMCVSTSRHILASILPSRRISGVST